MRGNQLLLLAERVEKPERVRAEAHDRHEREQRQRAGSAASHPHALAQAARREHHERQHQSSRCLHADADHEQRGCAAKIGNPTRPRGAGREHQRAGEHEQHERIVVRSADGQLE